MEQDDIDLKTWFSRYAQDERQAAPSFEATLGRARWRHRGAAWRVALAALVLAGGAVSAWLVWQGRPGAPDEPMATLPDLLETPETRSPLDWQSPTAVLLQFRDTLNEPASAPAGTTSDPLSKG